MGDGSLSELDRREIERGELQKSLDEYDSRVYKAYEIAKKIQVPGEGDLEEQYVLTIDEIPAEVREVRLKQLNAKFLEYTERLGNKWAKKGGPIDGLIGDGDLVYKRDTLGLFLQNKHYSIRLMMRLYAQLSDELSDPDNAGNLGNMANAFIVINDYAITGGSNSSQGTGLPIVQ